MEYYKWYIHNNHVNENQFLKQKPENVNLPSFQSNKKNLPQPFWKGHQKVIDCYWKTWELAFKNIRKPTKKNGFIRNYIDTAFNNAIFMWDTTFILLFAKYGNRAFNFQKTLDNFYCKQHPDGYISREIDEENGRDRLYRFDPGSTGPNVIPWAEWDYYMNFGDKKRLSNIFTVLLVNLFQY